MSYLDTTHDVYKEAALTPDVGLCCTTNPIWELPGLKIPKIMQETLPITQRSFMLALVEVWNYCNSPIFPDKKMEL